MTPSVRSPALAEVVEASEAVTVATVATAVAVLVVAAMVLPAVPLVVVPPVALLVVAPLVVAVVVLLPPRSTIKPSSPPWAKSSHHILRSRSQRIGGLTRIEIRGNGTGWNDPSRGIFGFKSTGL